MSYNLGQKVLIILHLRICYCYGPSPRPTLVRLFSQVVLIEPDLNIVFWGEDEYL